MASTNVEFKCFVGGLDLGTDEKDLERTFSQFDNVINSKIICENRTRRSKGFGFVTFKDEKSMRDAIKEMNGNELDGNMFNSQEDTLWKRLSGDEMAHSDHEGFGRSKCYVHKYSLLFGI